MIVCPNCNHQNPDGAVQCEACYTPLPEMIACPNCQATVQADASFCGQCGFNLQSAPPAHPAVSAPVSSELPNLNVSSEIPDLSPPQLDVSSEIPDLTPPDPLIQPDPIFPQSESGQPSPAATQAVGATPASAYPPAGSAQAEAPSPPVTPANTTQLQQQVARLLHIQTNTVIELPHNLALVHIGKPNDRIPPDIDVSGFPSSEIVSRVHADIRVEGDIYYIEDVGSSNGTYVNNLPLPLGNRHRLRPGDRIALGKGDKVSFIFQLS